MKAILSTFTLLYVAISIGYAQVGSVFPELSGQTLTEEEVMLPEGANGKYTLIGMAYSKRAEEDLKTWFQPIYRTFVQERESAGLFVSFAYDINVYFIPMFTGAKRVASSASFDKAKKGLDYRLHPLVLFYVGGLDEYRDALEFEGRKKPYFFLLDEEGTIVWAGSGSYSPEKIQEIEGFLDGLE